MAQSSDSISTADAERIRRRYPRSRLPRALWLALVVVGAVIAGSWLVWAALNARPDVSAVISAYTVRSDTAIEATLTVDRSDPTRAAACRVQAQATDFQPVAEQTVQVPPSAGAVINIELQLTTLRRATTAVVRECALI